MAELKLTNVRIAFTDALFTPKAIPGVADSKPAYSSTFLVAKGSDQEKQVRAAMLAAMTDKFGAKAKQILDSVEGNSNRCNVQDGDKTTYDGFENHLSIRAKNKTRPTVIDRQRNQLTDDGTIYSGCYVNAIIEFFGYDNPSKGISASLKGVQFVRDGDAFSGGRPASADAFDDLGDQGGDEDLVG